MSKDKIGTAGFPRDLRAEGWFLPTDYVISKPGFRHQLLEGWVDGRGEGLRILDLNAGTHGPGPELLARGHDYLALEANPRIREALEAQGLEARPWTPPRVPVDDASRDLVLSLAFLEHLPTWHAALETLVELRRVLRPGGRIVGVAPNAAAMGRAFWDDYKHGWVVTPKRVRDMAEEIGLRPSPVRYTLGWIRILHGPSGAVVGGVARAGMALLNVGPVARTLEATGLGRFSEKVRKTVFELFVFELTRTEEPR